MVKKNPYTCKPAAEAKNKTTIQSEASSLASSFEDFGISQRFKRR